MSTDDRTSPQSASTYDPDAPVTHSHAGGIRHTHRDPSIKHDPQPDPIPNIVLHPGDTIAIGAFAGDVNASFIRLLDRHGVCYAVLDCERDAAGHGWLIHHIRFVADYLTAGAEQTPPGA